jgi:hypothetical protein
MLTAMRWMMLPYIIVAVVITGRALAQRLSGDPIPGRWIATRLCGSCHQVLPMTHSNKSDPPSFQSIADLPSTTGISLNAFLHSNHRNMPNIIIESEELNDLIAYILSLKQN